MARLAIPLPGNGAFAAKLARQPGFESGVLTVRRFPDGERHVRLGSEVTGRHVDIVCTLNEADEHFLPLAFAADALRDLGAISVNLVAPYLGYMRQDARFRVGEAVTSRTFARLLSQVVDSLLTVDPHLHRISSLAEIYSIPARAVSAAPEIAAWIRREAPDALVIGPDAESEQWARQIAEPSGVPYVVMQKVRSGDRDVHVDVPDLTPYRGRRPVLVDDIASSGRTLAAAAHAIAKQGMGRPDCVVVHAIFAGDALDHVRPVVSRLISTDSIEHPTNAISLAPLIGRALTDG